MENFHLVSHNTLPPPSHLHSGIAIALGWIARGDDADDDADDDDDDYNDDYEDDDDYDDDDDANNVHQQIRREF